MNRAAAVAIFLEGEPWLTCWECGGLSGRMPLAAGCSTCEGLEYFPVERYIRAYKRLHYPFPAKPRSFGGMRTFNARMEIQRLEDERIFEILTALPPKYTDQQLAARRESRRRKRSRRRRGRWR